MADNPFTSPTLSGFNASPPPDDGTVSSDNKVEWAKHISKIGTPLKNYSDDDVAATLAAFAALIITDHPAEEGIIISQRMFS